MSQDSGERSKDHMVVLLIIKSYSTYRTGGNRKYVYQKWNVHQKS